MTKLNATAMNENSQTNVEQQMLKKNQMIKMNNSKWELPLIATEFKSILTLLIQTAVYSSEWNRK